MVTSTRGRATVLATCRWRDPSHARADSSLDAPVRWPAIRHTYLDAGWSAWPSWARRVAIFQAATNIEEATHDERADEDRRRLSEGRYRYWPKGGAEAGRVVEAHELRVLLSGGDFELVRRGERDPQALYRRSMRWNGKPSPYLSIERVLPAVGSYFVSKPGGAWAVNISWQPLQRYDSPGRWSKLIGRTDPVATRGAATG